MKTNKLLLIILFLFSIHSFSQPKDKEKREKIRSLKVGFLTTELSLTPDEAAVFWPLYNAFDNKQNEIRSKKTKSLIDKMDNEAFAKMNEKEAFALLAQSESYDEDLFQNRRKFISSLKGVISPIKIIKLKKAEDNFNKKLLQQYRDKGPRK
jgi:hypothetical protein